MILLSICPTMIDDKGRRPVTKKNEKMIRFSQQIGKHSFGDVIIIWQSGYPKGGWQASAGWRNVEWDALRGVRRERIYPFRKVGKHPWFIGREMVRQHRRAPGCPPPHRLRFGKITFHRVLSHLIPFNKTLKNRSVSAGASHPPYGVVQHFSIQHTPIKTLPGGTDKSVPYETSRQIPISLFAASS